MEQPQLKKDIGLFIATALVAGNMMGSGIFMLPATLAQKAGPGSIILAWILTGMGSIFLALSFANLGTKYPRTGGPYEFSRRAFGNFTGFLNAWLYWNGSWIGNVAVIIAIASYAGSIFPILTNNHVVGFVFTSVVLWVFTGINILGVRLAGKIQTMITAFEIFLFLGFIIVAAIHFHGANLTPLFPHGQGLGTTSSAASSTLWAFIGLESATVAAGEIRNPERNIRRSTILGISIATMLYMAINVFAIGAMGHSRLAQSSAPIADILSQFLGGGVGKVVTIAAVISILGTTIGWLLSTARIAFAAGEDGVFPKAFAKVHSKYQTPYMALIIGSVLANLLLLMNYTKSFNSAFIFVTLLATLSYLPVYAFTAASEIMLMKKMKEMNLLKFIKVSLIPLLGFLYAGWAIYGSGAQTVMYGFLLMLAGVPFYLYMNQRRMSEVDTIEQKHYEAGGSPVH
ncbi:amino acid permease [Alicyclobacillus cycloheptanicus]|uniref:Amino acid transporter n=1 Tax=Alicyclobacillus cycloheptanicus TaxID=1457 RepID=A0ABT9XMC0_9BACL|nr:amino acid permease [Alicyclobacillus cycloheptanicus]MDQ0191466.1 amino acid transporter [Alicyclobacillus cycloheptanicus]WDM00158.1 amino acid permease [Alicyclobacillus cycloheptanicus]